MGVVFRCFFLQTFGSKFYKDVYNNELKQHLTISCNTWDLNQQPSQTQTSYLSSILHLSDLLGLYDDLALADSPSNHRGSDSRGENIRVLTFKVSNKLIQHPGSDCSCLSSPPEHEPAAGAAPMQPDNLFSTWHIELILSQTFMACCYPTPVLPGDVLNCHLTLRQEGKCVSNSTYNTASRPLTYPEAGMREGGGDFVTSNYCIST